MNTTGLLHNVTYLFANERANKATRVSCTHALCAVNETTDGFNGSSIDGTGRMYCQRVQSVTAAKQAIRQIANNEVDGVTDNVNKTRC